MRGKKGFAISEIPTLAITLGIIAVVIGIMATVLIETQNTTDGESYGRTTSTQKTYNESKLIPTAPNTTFNFATAYSNRRNFGACSNVTIYNHTGTDVTSSFTVSGCSASFTTATSFANKTYSAIAYTYTLYEYGQTWNITQDGIDAQDSFADWQGTFVVIIAAAVVIGIIGAYLFFRARE